MRTEIIKIGNSKGIRIPKALLDQCGLHKEVQLVARNNSLVITPYSDPRAGWATEFKRMAEARDDMLLDDDVSLTTWDDEEWEW